MKMIPNLLLIKALLLLLLLLLLLVTTVAVVVIIMQAVLGNWAYNSWFCHWYFSHHVCMFHFMYLTTSSVLNNNNKNKLPKLSI